MKKILKCIFGFLLVITLFSYKQVFAGTAGISASTTSAYVGDTVTITVNYYAAAWNLTVSGAINDTIVGYDPNGNSVSGSQSFYLSPGSAGTYTVRLSGDVSDDNGTNYPSGSVTVTFSNRPAQPDPPSNPFQPAQPATPDNRSSNANLKSIGVEGYDLTQVDDTHYTLSVKHSVDRVTIKGEAEDSKAKVDGLGAKELKEGENPFEIVVTAENGTTKTYVITITRRSTVFTLEQIKDAIKDSENSDVDLVIGEKTKLTADDLKEMKDSKKTFHITKYDEDKKVIYSWTIFGKSIKKLEEFDTTVDFKIQDKDAFEKAMEYVDGILVSIKGNAPEGTQLKLSVGDKYTNSSQLHLFSYVDGKRKGSFGEYAVINGFVEFPLKGDMVYFLTKASFEKVKSGINYWIPVTILEFMIILLLLIKRNKKKEKVVEEPSQVVPYSTNEPEPVTTPVITPETTPVMTVSTQPEVMEKLGEDHPEIQAPNPF